MTHSSKPVAVYLEIGMKRTLAGALAWPGWCRGGRDEAAALQALFEYAPRYELVLRAGRIPFDVVHDVSTLDVVESLTGNTTTDFGAPDVAPSADAAPVDDVELERLQELLQACWAALDSAAQAAQGKELRKGPRGGGRDVAGIVQHVLGAEASYVARLGGKLQNPNVAGAAVSGTGSGQELDLRRQVILDALGAAARGEFPAQGPRGGTRWSPRFFVRRAAWHILDHVWEIQDRSL